MSHRFCFDERKVRDWAVWLDCQRIRSRAVIRKQWPRRGEAWSQGEDRRLLRLIRKYERQLAEQGSLGRNPFGPGSAKVFVKAAEELGRTPGSIVTRLAILRVAQRGL